MFSTFCLCFVFLLFFIFLYAQTLFFIFLLFCYVLCVILPVLNSVETPKSMLSFVCSFMVCIHIFLFLIRGIMVDYVCSMFSVCILFMVVRKCIFYHSRIRISTEISEPVRPKINVMAVQVQSQFLR